MIHAMASTDTRTWPSLTASLDDGGPVPVGLLLLATDRASGADVASFLPDGVESYATRIPMDLVATPETLARLGDHLTDGARLLAPGGPLAAIGFSCTSGTVAVGAATARARIAAGRPGIPVCTPVEAAVKALDALGTRRIALLTPYLDGPSNLIADFFADGGIEVVTRASFKLDGDPEMNRVTRECLIDAGREPRLAPGRGGALHLLHRPADARRGRAARGAARAPRRDVEPGAGVGSRAHRRRARPRARPRPAVPGRLDASPPGPRRRSAGRSPPGTRPRRRSGSSARARLPRRSR